MIRDVVCGMELDPEDDLPCSVHEGLTHYFCSEACKHEFDSEPEKYAGFEGVV